MLDSNVNEKMRKLLGANLRSLRQSRGYSQLKFAEIVGATQAAISAWELGTREPELGTVFQIAKTFMVPVSSLLPVEESGLDEDMSRKVLSAVGQNPGLGAAILKMQYFDAKQLAVVTSVIDAISTEAGSNE